MPQTLREILNHENKIRTYKQGLIAISELLSYRVFYTENYDIEKKYNFSVGFFA